MGLSEGAFEKRTYDHRLLNRSDHPTRIASGCSHPSPLPNAVRSPDSPGVFGSPFVTLLYRHWQNIPRNITNKAAGGDSARRGVGPTKASLSAQNFSSLALSLLGVRYLGTRCRQQNDTTGLFSTVIRPSSPLSSNPGIIGNPFWVGSYLSQ